MKLLIAFVFLSLMTWSGFGQKRPASPAPKIENYRQLGESLKNYGSKKKTKRESIPAPVETKSTSDDEAIRIETDLVVNDVLVMNPNGGILSDLTKKDFVVVEDGVPQNVDAFNPPADSERPRSIVLIMDFDAPQLPYIGLAFEGARQIVDRLRPNDQIAIVTVDSKVRLEFTSDRTVIRNALNTLAAEDPGYHGNRDIEALLAVLDEMFIGNDRQRVVLYQCDATQAIWLKVDKDMPVKVSEQTLLDSGMKYTGRTNLPDIGFAAVRRTIEESNVTIYSIVPGPRFLGLSAKETMKLAKKTLTDSHYSLGGKDDELFETLRNLLRAEAERKPASQAAMAKIAEWSGGFTGFIETPADAATIYDEVFKVMNNRYSIGYYPTNKKRDGTRREVKITVRDHPEYTVTTRRAYVR